MSRTTDMKLSGWVTEINFEYDFKFMELLNNKGPYGYYIYVLLRNAVCGQFGYYAIYNDVLLITIYHKLSKWVKSMKFVKETITYLGELGILDKSLLQDNIITSAEIQESWLTAKRAKRARISENLKYWLLDDVLPSNKDNNCNNNNYNCNNYADNCNKKADNCDINKTIQDKLVNQASKDIIIDNTAFSEIGENKKKYADAIKRVDDTCAHLAEERRERIENAIKRINEEASAEPFDTDKYSVASLYEKYISTFNEDDEFEVALYFQFNNEEIRNKYLILLSKACYETKKQKYGDIENVDYKIFRAFVNGFKLYKFRSLIKLMEISENVENEEYYMRGIIVNWVIELYTKKNKE